MARLKTAARRRGLLAPLAALSLLLASAAAAAGVPSASLCGATGGSAFAVELHALTDPSATELVAVVKPLTAECPAPQRIEHLQVKTFASDGRLVDVQNLKDVPSPGGRAVVDLPALARGHTLAAMALVRTEQTRRTVVLRAQTGVLLRPDLAVGRIAAPPHILGGRPFTFEAQVEETNGDVGVSARAVLVRGDTGATLAETALDIPAGERVTAALQVELDGSGAVPLRLDVVDASVREVTDANNRGETSIEVTEFQVDPDTIVLPWIAGYGAQFNHSLFYLPLNPNVPPGAPALEDKVETLEPQLVRLFFPPLALTQPERLAAFVQVVELAQKSGAIINVTWQSNSSNIETNMSRFAGVLADLVKNRGVSNLRWVTLLNEPNSTLVTLETYERMYRTLDGHLRTAGVRDQVRFMGGDLVQDKQREWFAYMAEHMTDILDAYSIHVFWDFWDTAKLESRLADVRSIHDLELPPAARKPIYVTEYGVRGIRRPGGGPLVPEPGVWFDGTVMSKTNIGAFQLGWFDVLAARSAYPGTVVWDLFNAKYDAGTQDYSCIGPAPDFQLRPCYSLLRLFTATIEPGWSVLGVDGEAGRKLLTAYSGADGLTTVIGLDRAGGQLNDASGPPVAYSIAGLPPATPFRLVVWNRDGTGVLTADELVTTDALGIAKLTVPQHAIWSLTTHPVGA